MPMTLQVLYPVSNGSTFDDDYYQSTHMGLVAQHMGAHIQSQVVTKGLAGGPDTPPGFHAIATFVFADQAAFDATMADAGPVLADLPNFTNVTPTMLIGQTYD
ncbi:EthD family reductase [uncultured Tateyamaria sp.]|uniref:EthD family reductase n=1 Tax=uncultured Tateyamaria sp. TaxID=455651 RepID=UPI002624DE9B|nr:EthD family reductase [uncultured Tateyamaria sp.]